MVHLNLIFIPWKGEKAKYQGINQSIVATSLEKLDIYIFFYCLRFSNAISKGLFHRRITHQGGLGYYSLNLVAMVNLSTKKNKQKANILVSRAFCREIKIPLDNVEEHT